MAMMGILRGDLLIHLVVFGEQNLQGMFAACRAAGRCRRVVAGSVAFSGLRQRGQHAVKQIGLDDRPSSDLLISPSELRRSMKTE